MQAIASGAALSHAPTPSRRDPRLRAPPDDTQTENNTLDETSPKFRPSPNFKHMKKYLKSKFEEDLMEEVKRASQQNKVMATVSQPPLPPNSPPPGSPLDVEIEVKKEIDDEEYERNNQPPPRDPTSPMKSSMGPGAAGGELSDGGASPAGKDWVMCKDWVRNTCTRGAACIYTHKVDKAQLKEVYRFCRDFANKRCTRPVCYFAHATTFEKEHFLRTAYLPPHATAHLRPPTVPAPAPAPAAPAAAAAATAPAAAAVSSTAPPLIDPLAPKMPVHQVPPPTMPGVPQLTIRSGLTKLHKWADDVAVPKTLTEMPRIFPNPSSALLNGVGMPGEELLPGAGGLAPRSPLSALALAPAPPPPSPSDLSLRNLHKRVRWAEDDGPLLKLSSPPSDLDFKEPKAKKCKRCELTELRWQANQANVASTVAFLHELDKRLDHLQNINNRLQNVIRLLLKPRRSDIGNIGNSNYLNGDRFSLVENDENKGPLSQLLQLANFIMGSEESSIDITREMSL